MMFYINVKF